MSEGASAMTPSQVIPDACLSSIASNVPIPRSYSQAVTLNIFLLQLWRCPPAICPRNNVCEGGLAQTVCGMYVRRAGWRLFPVGQ